MATTDPFRETAHPGAAPATAALDADVLVVGGGLAGGALTCALAGAGLAVVTVDAEDPARFLGAGFDGRASAIAAGSQRVLDAIGLWPAVAPEAQAIEEIRVSDGALSRGDSLFFLHYDHQALGDEPFGFMVENRTLRRALMQTLPAMAGVTYLAPARVADLAHDLAGVRATLDDGRRVRARLVVGADGRRSQMREAAGIRLTQWSYGQTGIVCTVAHEYPHNGVAQEHFLPGGPFAILPLRHDRASLVWTEKDSLAPAIMALDDDEFLFELRRRFGDYLGDLRVVGPRWAYPLSLQFAETYVATRLCLVADAAHGMHPIAGQGLNMGLRDVAALAEVLADAHRLGLDLGSATVLARYARWRGFDNTLMLAMTDLLNRLFSNDVAPVRLARDLGMAAVNQVPPLKRFFMRHAMGLVGELPRLMRGEAL
ncbi:MAG: UbiH/UbiF/VisC/COQ6 family ubiquinone biosynthesis hydroxylase [Hyphomicrobiales bacterium]|nr:UbiH/UbiF/VisC/COQ6 family ubiquinone biosynthesis hydroxylase [Hyphomicrobiales bacterium]MCP5370495.1 UbiH/UbiF/VisC/COQ6 family ubiquinone biosynthesis hydroxylase [Hyphomicrobiales bacterium]